LSGRTHSKSWRVEASNSIFLYYSFKFPFLINKKKLCLSATPPPNFRPAFWSIIWHGRVRVRSVVSIWFHQTE
jgi:hypothetical protein